MPDKARANLEAARKLDDEGEAPEDAAMRLGDVYKQTA